MTPEQLAELRRPFPPESVGKLPKGNTFLDYVGHAAVTDRLLLVDPTWTWEPVAVDEHGLPAYDRAGGLWIRLTICGVTRLGYGDGPDPKQRIGDALRNAAMRFGVALDLWSKEELEGSREPAVVTDQDWFRSWWSRVQGVTTETDLKELWVELQGATATKVGNAEFAEGAALVKQRKAELDAHSNAGTEAAA